MCVVIGYGKSTKLSNCKFHECVKVDSSTTMRIHPPEGEVVLVAALYAIMNNFDITSAVQFTADKVIYNSITCWFG